ILKYFKIFILYSIYVFSILWVISISEVYWCFIFIVDIKLFLISYNNDMRIVNDIATSSVIK
ncbi:hypothetical protein YA30_17600, partial [Klebsiella aerogenes]|uniref:hypothetical protein n=1 Tax=Klebsiella aerogenes TaxID=548 RepID=UPI00063C3863